MTTCALCDAPIRTNLTGRCRNTVQCARRAAELWPDPPTETRDVEIARVTVDMLALGYPQADIRDEQDRITARYAQC